MPTIEHAAPQLLVDDLGAALAFYEKRLGFTTDFVYEGFYASVSRDGSPIHLKCAPKLDGERAHRKTAQHLDVFVAVTGVRELHDELHASGANVVMPLGEQPWGAVEFWVEDPEGHILAFSELASAGA